MELYRVSKYLWPCNSVICKAGTIKNERKEKRKGSRQKSSKTDDIRSWKRNWPDSGGDLQPRRVRVVRRNEFRGGRVNNCYIGDGCLITFSFTLWKRA